MPEHQQEQIKAMEADQKRMRKLIDAVDVQREYMMPKERARLEDIEKRQWDKFVEMQEGRRNPPSETFLQKIGKQLFNPKP